MILIISNQDDLSTNEVIDWLLLWKKPFVRMSCDDKIKFISVNYMDNKFDINFQLKGIEYRISDFKKIWYRRSWIEYEFDSVIDSDSLSLLRSVNNHLNWETREIGRLFLELIRPISINNFDDINLNKLTTLSLASSLGLTIPESLITRSKKELKMFIEQHQNVITKNISPGVFIKSDESYYTGYTECVSQEVFDSLPDYFFPTLFQKMITKEFELRCFFLNGVFYNTAIFSQSDDKTKVDFRNYNFARPNRTPPFKLPKNVESKLLTLMDTLKMRSGSIDLIYAEGGEFVFLEINPIGLFTQVSRPCNYRLDEKLAKALAYEN